MVALRTTSRPQPAAPAWAGPVAAGWTPEPPRGASASALAQAVFPRDGDLSGERDPFEPDPREPDPEAAAFLNAPRRPLGFYVAPFGTPPYGNPPSGGGRSVFGGPLEGGAERGRPDWGPAYPAGA